VVAKEGWDDFPHPGNVTLEALESHPHHLQIRLSDGSWQFYESSFHGILEQEIPIVLAYLTQYLNREK